MPYYLPYLGDDVGAAGVYGDSVVAAVKYGKAYPVLHRVGHAAYAGRSVAQSLGGSGKAPEVYGAEQGFVFFYIHLSASLTALKI